MERIILFAVLVFCATLFLFTPSAQAWHTNDPFIHQRLERQEHRINRGIASGRITPAESARLWGIQARIRNEEFLMKYDGRLTGQERLRLQHDLNRSSWAINRMIYNNW